MSGQHILWGFLAFACLLFLVPAGWILLGLAANRRTQFVNQLCECYGGVVDWRFNFRAMRKEAYRLTFSLPVDWATLEFRVEFRQSSPRKGIKRPEKATRLQVYFPWAVAREFEVRGDEIDAREFAGFQVLRDLVADWPRERWSDLRCQEQSVELEFPGVFPLREMPRMHRAIAFAKAAAIGEEKKG